MTRKEELVAEACKRWKDGDKVESILNVPYKWHDGIEKDFHSIYQFQNENGKAEDFYYDEIEDTLCNWGRGLGLIYYKGRWAEDKIIHYEIY